MDMKIQYGVVCPNQQAICNYLSVTQITDWRQVRAVKIALLLISSQSILHQAERFHFAGILLPQSRYLQREWDIYAALY